MPSLNIATKLLIAVAIIFVIAIIPLTILGHYDIVIYLSLIAIAFLIITSLVVDFKPKFLMVLNVMSAIIVVGFLVYVGFRVFNIIK